MEEFQKFYQENINLIYRYVYGKVGNREEAEDLTSRIFLKAVRDVDLEQGAQRARSWLLSVARTTVADHWRGHYRSVPTSSLDDLLDAGWEGPIDKKQEQALESSETGERVQRILQGLPERYREVLMYRFLLNLSVRETALLMDLTEANVKVIQFRALKRAADLEPVILDATGCK